MELEATKEMHNQLRASCEVP